MSYNIEKTDGTLYATVADGTVDSTTSLKLVGRNYTGFGKIQNENYFRLLESHANTTAPVNPQTGQLWFDTANSVLNVYQDGTTPKSVALQATALTEPLPADSQTGDTWYNTTTHQLTVYNGDTLSYDIVGPLYSSTEGESGAIVSTVTDDIAGDHIVTMLMNGAEIVAIVSKDASFTPDPVIGGFATIGPGITMSTTVAGAQFTGDASNALLLNGQSAADFLSSTTDNSTTGKLDIVNDTGLTIGLGNDIRFAVEGGIHGLIINDTAGGDINFATQGGIGLTLDAASGNARVGAPNNSLDVVNQSYVLSIGNTKLDLSGGIMNGDVEFGVNHSLLADGGSATVPSIAFQADPDTGLYSVSANSLALTTGGVRRLTIESNGTLNVAGTANYENLVTADDDIPNKKYVDDNASKIVAMDFPDLYTQTINTGSTSGWQTITINANAKYAFVSAYCYGIFDTGGGQVTSFARKKGLSGAAGPRWEVAEAGGSSGGTYVSSSSVTAGSVLVECNALGQIETYASRSSGSVIAPSAHIIVKGWVE